MILASLGLYLTVFQTDEVTAKSIVAATAKMKSYSFEITAKKKGGVTGAPLSKPIEIAGTRVEGMPTHTKAGDRELYRRDGMLAYRIGESPWEVVDFRQDLRTRRSQRPANMDQIMPLVSVRTPHELLLRLEQSIELARVSKEGKYKLFKADLKPQAVHAFLGNQKGARSSDKSKKGVIRVWVDEKHRPVKYAIWAETTLFGSTRPVTFRVEQEGTLTKINETEMTVDPVLLRKLSR